MGLLCKLYILMYMYIDVIIGEVFDFTVQGPILYCAVLYRTAQGTVTRPASPPPTSRLTAAAPAGSSASSGPAAAGTTPASASSTR